MSFIQGTSRFVLESSLQLSDFVDILLEPLKKSNHFYLIKLGLHEALVNAVKHGNKLDPPKGDTVNGGDGSSGGGIRSVAVRWWWWSTGGDGGLPLWWLTAK